ncbi:MAG TPA: inorganic phosphate transporter [Bacteroidales bacterium]|nr:inorganic phosphate transporter [Bacteroidales bacterium]
MGFEQYYIILLGVLFLLAVFGIYIGVSNDAVNFLQSAVGSKAANINVVLIIAAIGIFLGAGFSNGMMDIARQGVFSPQYYTFQEVMIILVSTMMMGVILMDLFNVLGLPTSTTVSLVFGLLGAAFAVATIKINQAPADAPLTYGILLNTEKALQVVLAIFISVALAFAFGALIMYITRIVFTFQYKPKMKYLAGIFGGVALTSILYFMLLKGVKDTSFMSSNAKLWINSHTDTILISSFLTLSVLMQVLHWLKVNTLKVIVLTGTASLAFAFAGNDLVNFIGVPMAGFSAFKIASQSGTLDVNMLMSLLKEPAHTEVYILLASGSIMIAALFTSKKAKNVIKTTINLSRQNEGDEMFSSSAIARNLVRGSRRMGTYIIQNTPTSVKKWTASRFSKEGVTMENDAAFDLIRAAIGLVVASSLIAIGTSLKLPLSTTYVTFMVAMGASLADKAWGRESAVYRVSGVINVVGGWFITAIAAFIITALMAIILYYGGVIAMIVIVALVALTLIRNQLSFAKKTKKKDENQVIIDLLASENEETSLALLRKYSKSNAINTLEYIIERYEQVIDAFCNEDLKVLRNLSGKIDSHKDDVKKIKRLGTLGIRKLSPSDAFERGLYFYQSNDFIGEMVYALAKISVASEEHVANNFNSLSDDQVEELQNTKKALHDFLTDCIQILENEDFEARRELYINNKWLLTDFHEMKRRQLKRIQNENASTKVSMVYLTVIQETHTLVSYTTNLLKVNRKLIQNC